MMGKVLPLGAGEVVLTAGLGLAATGEGDCEGEGDGEAGVEAAGLVAWGAAGVLVVPGAKKLEARPAGRAATSVAAEVMPG